jgi:protein SDA1
MASIRKANKKEDGNNGEARFAAMQLINDPQSFAEHLFNRLQGGSALKFDTKMLLIQVRRDPGPLTSALCGRGQPLL